METFDNPEVVTAATYADVRDSLIRDSGSFLVAVCHGQSAASGWWNHPINGASLLKIVRKPVAGTGDAYFAGALVAQKLCLIHSEISEAMEGHRKGLMDDKLPHRSMIEVELADAVIRIADLAGALGLDLGGAVAEKLAFNSTRADHRIENRLKDGGKAY